MSNCLHVEGCANVFTHRLPYRAHIRMLQQTDATVENVDGVHIQFDVDRCTPRTQEWLHGLIESDVQSLSDAVSQEALMIYNMKRFNGEAVDGEDITS